MTFDLTARHGDGAILTVIDGPGRIAWRRGGRASWTPSGVWPDARQAREVRRRLAHGEPLLVVLERPVATVPLLAEQLAAAPPAVTALVEDPTGEVVDACVPALDWLPEDLRRRGLAFLQRSTEHTRRIPAALLPALLLEEPVAAMAHVRFAHRLRPYPHLERDLAAIAAQAFGHLEPVLRST